MIDLKNKHIHAKEIYAINNKPAWAIVNTKSGSEIACVAYYLTWKRYVMFTDTSVALDSGCLESIVVFLKEKNT